MPAPCALHARRSAEMRARMSEGHPEAPLLLYVGRLGAGERGCCCCHCVSMGCCQSTASL